MSPVIPLLVEDSQVVEECERAVDWLDGELLCGGQLGMGWEMSLLRSWMGQGRGKR